MLGTDDTAAAGADTTMLYAGEQYDSSASMYYNRARYYDPSNGLFNRVDPFAGNMQDPQSLHKYAYCHNNPINAIDPTGQFSMPSVSMSMAVGSLLVGFSVLAIRVGQVARERITGYGNYLNTLSQEKENNSATIITHGLITNGYGWANDFISDLEQRAPNQDYYEFSWSGSPAVLGSVVVNESVHRIATNSFTKVVRAVQAKGYSNVNIIGHSWGTVISRDAQYAGVGNINTWFTMGSPLLRATTEKPSNLSYWLNIWCRNDPVIPVSVLGLGYSPYVDEQLKLNSVGVWGNLANHGIYWTDPVSLNRIGGRLSAQ